MTAATTATSIPVESLNRSFRAGALLFTLLVIVPALLILMAISREPLKLGLHPAYARPEFTLPLGTDELGRDLLARALLGGGLSLCVAGAAAAVAWMFAILLGTISAWRASAISSKAISYLLDLLQTIPFIVLAVALAGVLQAGLLGIAALMGIVACAAPARIVRAEVLKTRSSRYVLAQRALGHSTLLLFRTAYLPRLVVPPLLWLLLLIPELMTVDAGLSFFGLGAQPPTPTLGRLIYDGLNQAQAGWWLPIGPSAVLLILVILCHAVAYYLQRLLESANHG